MRPKFYRRRSPLAAFIAGSLLLGTNGLLLQGCAPPPKTKSVQQSSANLPPSEESTVNIAQIQPKWPGPFETKLIDGTEYRISRYPVGQPGGTLYDTQLGDGPKTFNTWASYDNTSSTLGGLLVAGLVDTDAYTGDVIPYLAKTVDIKPDKMTYVVTLRKGLKWSDGKPLTSKDVVFTWNEIIAKGLGNPSSRDNLLVDGKFPSVRAIDPLTIEFKTAKPFAPFLRQLGAGIAPEHIFKPVIAKGGDKAFSATWDTNDAIKTPDKLISSGMWILERYEPGVQVSYRRNPNFFMRDKANQPLPYLDRYVITFVKDLNTAQLRFEQGNVDAHSVPGQFVSRMRTLKEPNFTLYNLGPTTGTTFLTFNLSKRNNPSTKKPMVNPTQAAWFNDVNFRRAVDWAIDRDVMVKNILRGVGAPLFTAESPASIFINKPLAMGHPRDIARARAYLEQSGFTWDADGQLHDKKGNPVEFTLYTNTNNTERVNTGVSIKQDLEQLGMKVNFKSMDFNVLIDKMGSGDWEAIIMGLTGSPLEPHSGGNVWKSDSSLHLFNQRDVKNKPPGGFTDVLPWEKEIDRIFEQATLTFDKAERHALYNRFQEIAYEQLPFIYLYAPTAILAVRNHLNNVDPTPLGGWQHNLEALWVKSNKAPAAQPPQATTPVEPTPPAATGHKPVESAKPTPGPAGSAPPEVGVVSSDGKVMKVTPSLPDNKPGSVPPGKAIDSRKHGP